jgi:microcystin degradation protein MlrC
MIEADVPEQCICTIADHAATQEAFAADTGDVISLRVGGSICKTLYSPIEITGVLRRKVPDGRYAFTGPVLTGMQMDIGKSVVVQIGNLYVQVTEAAPYTVDPGHYYLAGLDPRTAKIVAVKSQGTFKGFYGPFAKRVLFVRTAGVCMSDLRGLPFRRLDRSIYPFDTSAAFVEKTDAYYVSAEAGR